MTIDDRPVWVLGDAHAGADPAADEALRRLLVLAATRSVDLLIMGDLFTAWLGPERFWTADQRRILDGIQTVRARGGRVRFVTGNRDYLTKELRGTCFDEVYDGEVLAPVGGRTSFLLHGDGLDPSDRLYRAWRALSRNPITTAALKRLPGAPGRWLAERAERALRPTNRRYKETPLPRDQLDAVGLRARNAGAERAIVGHFHRQAILHPPDGVPVYVAPGWAEYQAVLVSDPASGALKVTHLARLTEA